MLTPGTLLQGRYEIVRLIGHGGMGAVYEALDRRLGDNPVALKQSFFTTEQLRRAFEREANLLARLRHPNLPKVFDHFEEAQGQFLVMEYISGPDLEQLLADRGRPFPLETVLDWAGQILDALKYLHALSPPVIHRDIKPANLKLTTGGQIMLIDFGLAKGSGGTSSIVGYSAHYAPLEQLQREGTGPESDVYSCAATMYRLLTGEPPVTSLIRVTEKAKRRPDPLRLVHEVIPIIPATIGRVIEQAMELDKEDRLQSAVEMLEALRAVKVPADERAAPVAPVEPITPVIPVVPAAPTVRSVSPAADTSPERVTQFIEQVRIDTPLPTNERPTASLPSPAPPPVDVEVEPEANRETQMLTAKLAEEAPSAGSPGDYITNIFQPSAPETELQFEPPLHPLPIPEPIPEPAPEPAPVSAQASTPVSTPVSAPVPTPVATPISGPIYDIVPETSFTPVPDFAPAKEENWRQQVLSPEAPRLTESLPAEPRAPNRRLIWILAAFLVPVLATAYYLLTRPSGEPAPVDTAAPAAAAAATTAPAARREILHYGLELEDTPARLVAESDLPTGRRFRLHFRAPAGGYLYLIAPDEEKRPTAFLTSDPGPNSVKAGEDFVFPGGDNWINIGDGKDEVRFTVVFAPLRLAQFGFFQQLPRALTPAEIGQFEAFRKTLPALDVQPDAGRGGIQLGRAADATGPAVFDIVLRKKK